MVLQSIRENEPRTRAIGYPVERYKIVAVMLSGLFAGLAGVLYALQNQFAAPDFVFFLISGEVGDLQRHGRHRHAGRPDRRAPRSSCCCARASSRFFTEYYLIPLGIIFIPMVIFLPQGLLGFCGAG